MKFLFLSLVFLIGFSSNRTVAAQLSDHDKSIISAYGFDIPQNVLDLLAQPERPTPHDFLRALGGTLPEKKPAYLLTTSANSMQDFNAIVPRLIASLERIWPGGRYVSLGRDAAITSDILDAFYRMHGQTDRTARINASGASIRPNGKYVGASTVNPFLRKSIGLRLEDLKEDRPVVIMDRTGFATNSQSRRIMRGLYLEARTKNLLTPDFPELLNFVSLQRNKHPDTAATLEETLTRQIEAIEEGKTIFTQIQSLPGYTDFSEWHGTWSRFVKGEDGVSTTTPGGLMYLTIRLGVLSEFYDILYHLNSPEFTESLRLALKDMDVSLDHSLKLSPSEVQREARKEKTKNLEREEVKFNEILDQLVNEHLQTFIQADRSKIDIENFVAEQELATIKTIKSIFEENSGSPSFQGIFTKFSVRLFEALVKAFRSGNISSTELAIHYDHILNRLARTDSGMGFPFSSPQFKEVAFPILRALNEADLQQALNKPGHRNLMSFSARAIQNMRKNLFLKAKRTSK